MRITIGDHTLDDREIALWLARGRAVVGITCLVAPGIVSRVMLGGASREVKAMTRVAGIRDLALAVGAITNLKEEGQDAEWLGMGAVSDAVDAAVCMLSPGLPAHSRVVGIGAAAACVTGMRLARDLADARLAPKG